MALIGGRLEAVMYAKEAGADVVLVHEPGKFDPLAEKYCSAIAHADMHDASSIVDALRPLGPFDRVISPDEEALVPTARAAEFLGVPGNSLDTVRLLKNKALMRARLDSAGLSPVRHRLVHSEREVRQFVDEVGPVVLKPVDGAGSIGVFRIGGQDDVAAAWRGMLADGRQALAEEYLEGHEVSVEAFSCQGRHLVLGVNEKTLTPGFVEVGHTIPAHVSVPVERELGEITTRLLDAVGLVEGPSHTEFRLTPDGPRVLESHNRRAGGGVPALLWRARGVNLHRMTIAVPLGLDPLPEEVTPVGGAAIRFFAPPPGMITGFSGVSEVNAVVRHERPDVPITEVRGTPGLEELRDAEVGVHLQLDVGDEVPPMRSSLDRVSGYVIASGRDAREAVRRCDEVLEAITIHTEPR